MQSEGIALLTACCAGGIFGFLACWSLLDLEAIARWRRVLREGWGGGKESCCMQSGGLSSQLIEFSLRQSLVEKTSPSKACDFQKGRAFDLFDRKVRLAGLNGRLTWRGYCQARSALGFAFGICGFVFGLMFSFRLALLCAPAGFLLGRRSLFWALDCEAAARKQSMEAHLSEALEVLCLGLRSGLSFDYALKLYCRYFSGLLPKELERALGEWMSGLKPREEALRDVAAGYDSAILLRVVESVIRSMRFGSPLAVELEALAKEARQRHKADVEERVMKAPVKMMLPVGTLILPSMLILVLGPVLLGLSDGM